MRSIFLLLAFCPFFGFGQCDPSSLGTLRAEVYGDMVTLFNDTASRNCGAVYSMEITSIGDDTLKWLQRDLGSVAYCICNFNLSVTIDSLTSGSYTVKAYYQELMSGQVCFIGTLPFTVTQPGSYSTISITGQDQSPCFVVGEPESKPDNDVVLKVFPNPVREILHIQTSIPGEKIIRISDLRSVSLKEFTSGQNEISMDISTLVSGMFILTLQTKERTMHTYFCKY